MQFGEDKCPYPADEVLDDLLETAKLLDYQKKTGVNDKISMSHYNLNYHARAFEQADLFLRNAVNVLASPK